MKVRVWFGLMILCLALTGCGKKNETETRDHSSWWVNLCFMEDGFLYKNPKSLRMEYFDYKTGNYMPLCTKVNCFHDSMDCTAVYLGRKAALAGVLGDKLYYQLIEDEEGGFYCSDLNGENEKKLLDFSHQPGFEAAFYQDMCIVPTDDPKFDETWDWIGNFSGIYQIHFDTGEVESLCPEKETMGAAYSLCGLYENQLAYMEQEEQQTVLKIMNLDTKTIEEPLGDAYVLNGTVSENLLVCCVRDEGRTAVVELDLETGERTDIECEAVAADYLWTKELKLFTIYDQEPGGGWETWQYQEQEGAKLLRSGTREKEFIPYKLEDGVLIGQCETGGLAKMDLKDYLDGKENWTVLNAEP